MSDQDDFELRLGAAVKGLAAGADGPFDASQLAASALRTRNGGWLTRPFKRPARSHVLATAAIAVVFVAVASFAIALYAGRPSSNIAGPIPPNDPRHPVAEHERDPSDAVVAARLCGRSRPSRRCEGPSLRGGRSLRDLNEAELSQHHPGDARSSPGSSRRCSAGRSSSMAITFPFRPMPISTRATSCTSAAHRAKRTPVPSRPRRRRLRADDRRAPLRDGEDHRGPARPPGPVRDLGGDRLGDDRAGRAGGPRVEEAEATALVEDFLQARIDGDGAEELAEFAEGSTRLDRPEIPLLYATSTGAPYERSEFELVDGPRWPRGEMRVRRQAVRRERRDRGGAALLGGPR